MSEKQMTQLVRYGPYRGGGGVIQVDKHPITRSFFGVESTLDDPNRTCCGVARVNRVAIDRLAAYALHEGANALFINRTSSRETLSVLGKFLALRILHVVNKCNRAEGPDNQHTSSAIFAPAAAA